jgi:hypothetical protein
VIFYLACYCEDTKGNEKKKKKKNGKTLEKTEQLEQLMLLLGGSICFSKIRITSQNQTSTLELRICKMHSGSNAFCICQNLNQTCSILLRMHFMH